MSDPQIIYQLRAGTDEDPYVEYELPYVIYKNRISLAELPDEIKRVKVVGYFEIVDPSNGIASDKYFVDYKGSKIHFNESEEGKTVTVIWWGKGLISTAANRIHTKTEDGAVVETLQDVIDGAKDAIMIIEQVEEAMTDVVEATELANTAAIYATEQGDYAYEQGQSAAEATYNTIQAKEDIESNEQARIDAELIRISNESTRQDNEIDRADAENLRASAEIVRQSNEVDREENVLAAINAANEAILDAISAKEGAETATAQANTARDGAITSTNAADIATTNAISATNNANDAASNANDKANLADTATGLANIAIDAANLAALSALQAANDANTAMIDTIAATNDANDVVETLETLIENTRGMNEYSSLVTYYPNNIVTHNGSSYLALATITNITPSPSAEEWQLLAQRGVDGTGSVASVAGKSPDLDGNVTLVASDIGAETPSGAQTKADQAEENAKDYTDAQIALIPEPVIATQEEAEEGESNEKYMTPLRTKEAIVSQSPVKTVAGQSSDENGNISISAENIDTVYGGNVLQDLSKITSFATEMFYYDGVYEVGLLYPVPPESLFDGLGVALKVETTLVHDNPELYTDYMSAPMLDEKGLPIKSGSLISGCIYTFRYSSSKEGFILQGGFSHDERGTGSYSHAEGYGTVASGQASHAEGYGTVAGGTGDVTLSGNNSNPYYSHAEGNGTKASGNASHSEGRGTISSGLASHAEGSFTIASGESAHAEGRGTVAGGTGDVNLTLGVGVGDCSHAEGSGTKASGFAAHSEGRGTVASGRSSHAEGEFTTTLASYSHAEGYRNVAIGNSSHVEGSYNISGNTTIMSNIMSTNSANKTVLVSSASGFAIDDLVVIKIDNLQPLLDRIVGISGNVITLENSTQLTNSRRIMKYVVEFSGSHAEGTNTQAIKRSAHAEGMWTTASGEGAHVEGGYSTASGDFSHAEGHTTIASGIFGAHSEGYQTNASGQASHAEGAQTISSGDVAHSEGTGTMASGYSSHAEGAYTTASGDYSHAEGESTTASQTSSHAEGYNTKASGSYSHAGGYSTQARYNQLTMGMFNTVSSTSDTTYTATADAFIIGNGTGNMARSNAFKVTFDGKAYGLAAYSSSGADYAEMFEWCDGNESSEDRVGIFVTLDGDKIRKANSHDEYIVGIVSANPSVLGDSAGIGWKNKYVTDEWGRVQYHEVIVPAKTRIIHHEEVLETIIDENSDVIGTTVIQEAWDEVIEVAPERTELQPVYNPEWDSELEYISRELRKEWDAIGMLGKLAVQDDGTCQVNGYCSVNDDGIATSNTTGYRVIKRIDSNIIQVIFK